MHDPIDFSPVIDHVTGLLFTLTNGLPERRAGELLASLGERLALTESKLPSKEFCPQIKSLEYRPSHDRRRCQRQPQSGSGRT
jgi:hypothetical protein